MKRVGYCAKDLRNEIDSNQLIGKNFQYHRLALPEQIDGRTNIESLHYDDETEEFVVEGRRSASTWIGKYIAELYPDKRVKVSWISLDWHSGKIILCYDNANKKMNEE